MTGDEKKVLVNPSFAGNQPNKRVRSWPTAPWIETELQKMADGLAEGETIAEVGIGAGSYARALSVPAAIRLTVDIPMHQSSSPWRWPVADDSVDLLLSIDALHYEADVEAFIREAARVTRTTKLFVLLARSRENLQADGLIRFFPAAAERALPLLTEISVLEKLLEKEGLYCARRAPLSGNFSIDESLLRAIAHRELTGLGALAEDEFSAGVDKLKAAVASGDTAWPAHLTMLVCRKVRQWKPTTGPAGTPGMGMM